MTLPDDAAPQNLGSARPFRMYAHRYLEAGFFPIPVPARKKKIIVEGWTGHDGKYADADQINDWIDEYRPGANIALRLQDGLLGIDVDGYKILKNSQGEPTGRTGKDTFDDLVWELGALPDTWTSSARSDEVSGIRLFRVPEGMDWKGSAGPGIDIIQKAHRYINCFPSYNPDAGEQYYWYPPGEIPDGIQMPDWDELPNLDDIPELPEAWIQRVSKGAHQHREKAEDIDFGKAKQWIGSKFDATGPMCSVLAERLRVHCDHVTHGDAGGAHGGELNGTYDMVMLAAKEGCRGLGTALEAFGGHYTEVVSDRRDPTIAHDEFVRSVKGAVAQAIPAYQSPVACPHDQAVADIEVGAAWAEGAAGGDAQAPPTGRGPELSGNGRASDPTGYDMSDDGNAEHLRDLIDGNFLWVRGWDVWIFWDDSEKLWVVDGDGAVFRQARRIGPRIQEASRKAKDRAKEVMAMGRDREDSDMVAAGKEDFKTASQYGKWGETSRNRVRFTAMVDLLKSYPGITKSASDFDARTDLLKVQNGILELNAENPDYPWTFRDATREDFVTESMAAEYRPDEQFELWDEFLELVMPSPELRWWVQKAMGYALYGSNFDSKMFFFHGPTRTGKSTFVEAIAATFGSYSYKAGMSFFRDEKETGPNAEMIRALPRRFMHSAEAGSTWSLNAEWIKALTGDETQTARQLWSKEIVERIPAFTPYISTNSPPSIRNSDRALWRRLRVIPFDGQISEEKNDPHAKVRMRQEGGARILNWLLEGWAGYVREGIGIKDDLSDLPLAVRTRMADFRAGVSSFHTWLSEQTVNDARTYTPLSDLYTDYAAWCDEQGMDSREKLTKNRFSSAVEREGYQRKNKKLNGAKSSVSCFIGVVLRHGGIAVSSKLKADAGA